MVTGYRFFRIYHSLNLHFTTKYDVLKYGKKTRNVSEDIYNKRRDRDKFEGFARLVYNDKAAFHFCVANFVHGHDGWLYNSSTEAQEAYLTWRGYLEAFEYNFKREYGTLKGVMVDNKMQFADVVVKTKKGNAPPLLQLLVHQKVSEEFVVSLHNHTPFIERWYEAYKNLDPFLEQVTFTLLKYAPLEKLIVKDMKGKS